MAKSQPAEYPVPRAWLPRLDGGILIMALLIGAMGFYVLYPLILILINSFNVSTIAEPPAYGLQAWREAFSEPGILRSLWNSVKIGIVLQLIALPLGIFISWLLARTNIFFFQRHGVRLLDLIHIAKPGNHFWLDVAARSKHRADQQLAARTAVFEQA